MYKVSNAEPSELGYKFHFGPFETQRIEEFLREDYSFNLGNNEAVVPDGPRPRGPPRFKLARITRFHDRFLDVSLGYSIFLERTLFILSRFKKYLLRVGKTLRRVRSFRTKRTNKNIGSNAR